VTFARPCVLSSGLVELKRSAMTVLLAALALATVVLELRKEGKSQERA
jgi:hypothetical protein